MENFETDYLVIGAGAMGMAFADSLFDERPDAHITLVDRRHRPGGHWNDAYSFVRLHQPSAFYGVNSRELATGAVDEVGTNRGLHEMASGQAVLDHFDQLLRQKLLASGRVRFLSMTEHAGIDGQGRQLLRSLLDGAEIAVSVRRKVVHATHTGTEVPATHAPRYQVAAGIHCVPINALPRLASPHARYTVVGSGKTGIDACLWLLQNGTDPSRIRWVMPNDAWFLDRANVQPGAEHLPRFFGSLAAQFECVAEAESLDDLFMRLESAGQLLRLDPSVRPTKYRCATVTTQELAELRRIGNILRMGRVRSITPGQLSLDQGKADVLPGELFIDCTACGIPLQAPIPVFEDDAAIHLQYVRQCGPSFSAAFIAAVEARVAGGAAEKNAMCRPVPHPRDEAGWVTMQAITLANRQAWARHPGLMDWLENSRLDYATRARHQLAPEVMERYVRAVKAAAPRLPALLAACRPESRERVPEPAC
ncbi:NAD(P)-binding protein [Caenimonas sedimenti]|nr:NAD(P)-binding protein [Caenimonas sedimenti]